MRAFNNAINISYLCCCDRLFFPLTTNWILMFFRLDIFRSANYCSFEWLVCAVHVCVAYALRISIYSVTRFHSIIKIYILCTNIFKYSHLVNNLTGSGMNKHSIRTYSLDDDFDYFTMRTQTSQTIFAARFIFLAFLLRFCWLLYMSAWWTAKGIFIFMKIITKWVKQAGIAHLNLVWE